MKLLHLFCRQTGTRPIHVTIPKRYVYFWEVASFLSQQKGVEIESIDCLDLSFSTFNLTKKIILEKPDVLVCLVRIENIYQTLKLLAHIKTLDSNIKVIVYGDVVNLIGDFFKKIESIDAVVEDGDWELAIMSYVDYLDSKNSIPAGVFVKDLRESLPGNYFPGGNWSFPDVNMIPDSFYAANNEGRNQITITIARGCPYNCKFCLSVCTFGSKDRRKDVNVVLDFLEKHQTRFDSFKLFAPSFNVNSKWVYDLCAGIEDRKLKVAWCATSRIDLLDDEEIVKAMARAGCYKISVGIETINRSAKFLNKEFPREQIIRVAKYFKENSMTLKGLIMLGVPGQTRQDIIDLFSLLRDNGIKIRPTSFSPLDKLTEGNLSLEEIQKYDKFTFYDTGIENVSRKQYFNLLIDPDNFLEILKD